MEEEAGAERVEATAEIWLHRTWHTDRASEAVDGKVVRWETVEEWEGDYLVEEEGHQATEGYLGVAWEPRRCPKGDHTDKTRHP
jgi:hypothetical protein